MSDHSVLPKEKHSFLWAAVAKMETSFGIQYEDVQINIGKQYIIHPVI